MSDVPSCDFRIKKTLWINGLKLRTCLCINVRSWISKTGRMLFETVNFSQGNNLYLWRQLSLSSELQYPNTLNCVNNAILLDDEIIVSFIASYFPEKCLKLNTRKPNVYFISNVHEEILETDMNITITSSYCQYDNACMTLVLYVTMILTSRHITIV